MIFQELNQLEIRIASDLVALEDRIKSALQQPEVRETLQFVVGALVMSTLVLFARHVFGSDGAEFAQASTTMEGWVKGNPGKTAALAGLGIGGVRAMFVKDYAAFALPAGIGILAGILVGVVDASYTATI